MNLHYRMMLLTYTLFLNHLKTITCHQANKQQAKGYHEPAHMHVTKHGRGMVLMPS
jgi:hypothetical protein